MTVSGAPLSAIGGSGGGSSYQIYNKATNGQPAVFTALTGANSRDAYFTANPSELTAINNGPFAVGIGTTAEDPSSVPGSGWYAYINGAWENILGTLVGADGADGQPGQDGTADLTGVANGRVPYNNNGTLANSPMRLMPDGSAFIAGVTRIESGTLAMGPFINLSEKGGFVGVVNALGDEFTLVDYRTPRNAASSAPRILEYTEAENNFEIQTEQTTALSSPITFTYTPTLLARTNALIGLVGTDVTNFRFRIANAADTSEVLKYWPSEADWLDGTGQSIAAGQMTIDFGDSELPLNQNTQLQIDIRFDSGTLMGNAAGFPVLTAVLQRGQFVDVALTRDIPTVPTPRTDEEIRDVVVAMLQAGTNITLVEDDTNNTLTINASVSGTTPSPTTTDLRYGLSSQSDPALVDFASLTDEPNPTDPITISTGVTTAGQYFHIFSSNTHDIQTITDTVLSQIVYQEGGTGNIFTKTSDTRTESTITYDAYTIGPLNAGVDESYVLAFS